MNITTRRTALAGALALPALAALANCAETEAAVAALSTPQLAGIVKGLAAVAETAVSVAAPGVGPLISAAIAAMEEALTSGSTLRIYESILGVLQTAAPYITATPTAPAVTAKQAATFSSTAPASVTAPPATTGAAP